MSYIIHTKNRLLSLSLALLLSAAGNFHDGLAWVSIENTSGNRVFGNINKAGQQIIPCIYEKVQDFSCNRAAVQLDDVWQYINRAGKTIIRDSYIINTKSQNKWNHSTNLSKRMKKQLRLHSQFPGKHREDMSLCPTNLRQSIVRL